MNLRRKATRISETELLRQKDFQDKVRLLPKPQRSYFVQTFGCQLNEHDSENLAAMLEAMGFQASPDPEEADIYVLNTCSIRENADNRFFAYLGNAKERRSRKADLLVVVCGCMSMIPEHVERIKRSFPFVDIVFGPQDIYRFPELLHRRLAGSRRVYDVGGNDVIAEGLPVVRERHYRALCSIIYGCNNFCTYCIVPYTRGRERSRDPAEIEHEIAELERDGFSEIMLLGQNVNAYGKDLPPISERWGNNFAALLDRIASRYHIPRIRFMTSHPKDISLDLLDVMAAYPQIERHLHLPLQSGSDRILQAMNRHYTVERYLHTVEEARKRIPGLSITTDIIVGFPGETEADFEATLELVRKVAYDSAFTFQYSPRYGTPAALLEQQLPPELMKERFERLLELQNANAMAANQARVGKRYEVLIEGASVQDPRQLCGRPSDFHLINFELPEQLRGELAARAGLDSGDVTAVGAWAEGQFCEVEVQEARTFSLRGVMTRFKGRDSEVWTA